MDQEQPRSDLGERTAKFCENVIRFAKRVPINAVTDSLIRQMVRSGTSVGANYCETDDADSMKDFKFKIGLCRREAKETGHWLRMLATAEHNLAEDARRLAGIQGTQPYLRSHPPKDPIALRI